MTTSFAFGVVVPAICVSLGGCGFNGNGLRSSGAPGDVAAGGPDAGPAEDSVSPSSSDARVVDQVGDATRLPDAPQADRRADLATADLATADLATADLATADLAVADMAGVPDRNVSDTAACNPADAGLVNVSQGRPTTASSEESQAFAARFATDGDPTTRWSSNSDDDESITVDLGSSLPIRTVILNWERAFADEYEIQVSDDGMTFTTAFHDMNGQGGVEAIALQSSGRYVRMLGIKRETMFGYSLFEFQVFSPLPCQ